MFKGSCSEIAREQALVGQVVFTGGSFRQAVRIPVGVHRRGVGSRVQVAFLWKMREKGKGFGG